MKWIKRHTMRHSHPDIRAAGFWGTVAYDELCAIAGEFDLEDRVPPNYARPEFIADRTMASQLPDGVERIREGLARCVEVGLIALLEDGSYEVEWAIFKGDTGVERKRRQRARASPPGPPNESGTVPDSSRSSPEPIPGRSRPHHVTVPEESRDGHAGVPGQSRPRLEERRSEKRETSPLPPTGVGEPAPVPPAGTAAPPEPPPEPPATAEASPRPGPVPLELVPPEPAAGRLDPAGLVALWNRLTGGRMPPRPEGKRLRRIKARLAERPREADWLPAMEVARELRAVLGREVGWLTLDWLVREPGNAQRLVDGEFDWKLRERGVPRSGPLREIWNPGGAPAEEEGEEPIPADPESVWGQALARLRASVPEYAVRRWLVQVHQVDHDGETLTLGVPNPFVRDWIVENYATALHRAIDEAAGRSLEVVFLAGDPAVPVMEARA